MKDNKTCSTLLFQYKTHKQERNIDQGSGTECWIEGVEIRVRRERTEVGQGRPERREKREGGREDDGEKEGGGEGLGDKSEVRDR